MLEGYRDLFRQDAFKVGLISAFGSRGDIGCLVWDETPDGVEVEVSPGVFIPDSVRLSIACLEIDCRCAVVEREGCRLQLAFVR